MDGVLLKAAGVCVVCWLLAAGCCLGEAQIIHCGLISVKKLVIGLIGVDPGNMDLWSGRAEAEAEILLTQSCQRSSVFTILLY